MLLAPALLVLLAAAPPTPPSAPPPPPSAPAPAPAQASRRAGDWPERPSGRRVTLAEKMDVDEALEAIAKAAGWNLVANTGRVGDRTLVLGLHDVPVEEALDAVLEGLPLVATRRGGTVTVAPAAAAPAADRPVLSGFEKPTGKRFSGRFSETPVEDALRKVAEAGGLSIVLPPGVRGTVSADFRDAPVEDVLRVLLSQHGLVAAREGGIVTVARAGGASVVIRGGKRSLEFHVPDVDVEVGEALRDAREEARAERDAAREARDERHANDRVLSGDQVIGAGEQVGNVVVLRGNLRLEAGAAAREVAVIFGSVELGPGATVDEDLVAIAGDVHVLPGARVGGNVVSVGGGIVIDPGAEVEGDRSSVDVPGLRGALSVLGLRPLLDLRESPLFAVGRALALFATLFLLGLVLVTIAPRRVESVGASLRNAPAKSLLAGFLGTIALPVLGLLLVVTVIGIPLVPVQILAVLAAAVLGFTGLAMAIGAAVPLRTDRRLAVVQLAIGCAVLVLATRIPVVGAMIWIAAWLFTFGAVLRTRFGQSPATADAALPTTPVAPPPMPPR